MGNYSIFVGTVGQGLNISSDSGDTWTKIRNPMPSECNIRALRTYPDNPHRVLAGSDGLGLFRSDDNGLTWDSVDSPFSDLQVWSVAVDPGNPDTIFAGTRPEGFRSRDGGKSWDKLDMGRQHGLPHRHTAHHQHHRRPPRQPHRLGRHRGRRHVQEPRRWRLLAAPVGPGPRPLPRRHPRHGPAHRRQPGLLLHQPLRHRHQQRRGRELGLPLLPQVQ